MRMLTIYLKRTPGYEEIKELDLQHDLINYLETQGYQSKIIENGFESASEEFEESKI